MVSSLLAEAVFTPAGGEAPLAVVLALAWWRETGDPHVGSQVHGFSEEEYRDVIEQVSWKRGGFWRDIYRFFVRLSIVYVYGRSKVS